MKINYSLIISLSLVLGLAGYCYFEINKINTKITFILNEINNLTNNLENISYHTNSSSISGDNNNNNNNNNFKHSIESCPVQHFKKEDKETDTNLEKIKLQKEIAEYEFEISKIDNMISDESNLSNNRNQINHELIENNEVITDEDNEEILSDEESSENNEEISSDEESSENNEEISSDEELSEGEVLTDENNQEILTDEDNEESSTDEDNQEVLTNEDNQEVLTDEDNEEILIDENTDIDNLYIDYNTKLEIEKNKNNTVLKHNIENISKKDLEKYSKLGKKDLIDICKNNNFICKGNKTELITRIYLKNKNLLEKNM